jgi:hypothetical protein
MQDDDYRLQIHTCLSYEYSMMLCINTKDLSPFHVCKLMLCSFITLITYQFSLTLRLFSRRASLRLPTLATRTLLAYQQI